MNDAPGIMYQGSNRREKIRCKECKSDLVYYLLRQFPGADKEILYIGCSNCKIEKPAERAEDIRAFGEMNGKNYPGCETS